MANSSTFNFNWGSQQSHILEGLKSLAVGEISNVFLTDVTLACEGEYIEAHRLVLSLCSSFFKNLFNLNERISEKTNGIVILGHVSARDLRYILQYMYQGTVEVAREHVDTFLEAGDMLKIEGLMTATSVSVGVKPSQTAGGGLGASKPYQGRAAATGESKKPQALASSSVLSNPFRAKNPPVSVSVGSVNANDKDDDGTDNIHPNPSSIKTESSSEKRVPLLSTSFDDDVEADAGGGMMDDYGDTGGDSDFGDGFDIILEDTAMNSEVVGTSTGGNKKPVKSERGGGITAKRRTSQNNRMRDDSSSSDDDDDEYSSDDDSGSTEDYFDDPPPNKKSRSTILRRRFTWKLVQTFGNMEDARAHIRSDKTWKLHYARNLQEGKKYTYDCKVSRQCPSKLYVMDRETAADLYSTGEDHIHENVRQKSGLTSEIKEKIHGLWESGVRRPQKIMMALKKDGIEPKLSQVVSYIQYNIRNKM